MAINNPLKHSKVPALAGTSTGGKITQLFMMNNLMPITKMSRSN
jgi:hypothetical protein